MDVRLTVSRSASLQRTIHVVCQGIAEASAM
jgi:hypothetical protein